MHCVLTKVDGVNTGEFVAKKASLVWFPEATDVIAISSKFWSPSVNENNRAKSPISDKKLHLEFDIGETLLNGSLKILHIKKVNIMFIFILINAKILLHSANTNYLL